MKSAKRLSLLAFIVLTMAVWASAQVEPKDYLSQRTVDFSVARSLPYLTPGQMMFENVKVDDLRFAILMKWKKTKFEPIELRQLQAVQIPERTISVDGSDSDWGGISPVVPDPANDENSAYTEVGGTDLANVYLARDSEFLYVLMTFHDGDPIMNTAYFLELQQYLYQQHTFGDVIVGAFWGGMVSVGQRNSTQCPIANYQGYAKPGTGLLEWKVPIADLQNPSVIPNPYFSVDDVVDRGIENRFIRIYIHPFLDETPGPVADANDEMTRPLIINFYEQ